MMKRFFALTGALALASAGSVFADTKTLIDFTKLAEDGDGQNAATTLDYSNALGTSYTAEEKAKMKTSLAIANWRVDLNASAKTSKTDRLSYAKPATSSVAGGTVMGIRVNFPESSYAASAVVVPPFHIPATMAPGDTGANNGAPAANNDAAANTDANASTNGASFILAPGKFDGYGIVKNVGSLKSLSMNVRGLNFPNHVSVLLSDFNGKIREIPMGELNYDGWKTLTWSNPEYIGDVKNRTLKKEPIYPEDAPIIRFEGVKIYKDGTQAGGDFIGYIKDISVTYDKAIRDDVQSDIDDESTWQILRSRENARMTVETAKFQNRIADEFQAQKLQDTSTPNNFPQHDNIVPNSRTDMAQGGGDTSGAAAPAQ